MLFKTLTLKIYRPTKIKRQIIDNAMRDYSNALEWLLNYHKDIIENAAESKEVMSKGRILSLIDKEATEKLNDFNVEPFKDSLKMEFASIVSGYIAQKRKNNAGFPCITKSEETYDEEINSLIRKFTFNDISNMNFRKEVNSLISHTGRIHLLYFGRYSCLRDFCLLYDEIADRFFVKLYLLNKENKLDKGMDTGLRELKYIAKGMPVCKPSKKTRRYLVLPLAFGKVQYNELKRAIYDPSILHTAKVIKKNKEYYLLLNIECEQKKSINPTNMMGIARSEKGLHYTIPGVERGRIKTDYKEESRIYLIASKILKKAQKYKCQVVLESSGGKNDAVMKGKRPCPFSTTDYSSLSKVLSYKLPQEGLPAPIEVSANGLYNVCPKCGCRTNKNRLSEHIFACTECGYASLIEDIGSYGLAVRLEKYSNDKIPLYCLEKDNVKVYYNKALGFEFTEAFSSNDLSRMFYELSLYANSDINCANDSKKYCLIKKLREAQNIRNIVRIEKIKTTK